MANRAAAARHTTIVLVAAATAFTATLHLTIRTWAATPAKPLVLIFAGAPSAETLTGATGGVTATPTSPDGLLDPQRTRYAAREVRDRFGESNVAEAVLYSADAPLFLRAALDAKLKMADPTTPTLSERLALARTTGALYVVTITAQPLKNKPGSIQINLDSVEVATNKTYSDKTFAMGGSVLSTLPGATTAPASADGSAPPPAKLDDNAWMTASNTLVIRFLAGPLGEYTRALAPPSLLPPPPSASPEPAAPAALPPPQPTPTPPAQITPPAQPTPPTTPATTPAAVTTPAPTLTPTPAPAPTVSPAAPAPQQPVTTGAPGSRITQTSLALQASFGRETQQRADALMASGDVQGAIIILRSAINEAPRSLPLRCALARAYIAAGRTSDAEAEAQRAIAVASPDADRDARLEMTRLLADAYTKSGDQTAARAAYQEIVAAQPQAHWARIALGDLLLNQGDNDGAEAAYQAVLQTDPKNRDAVLGVARARVARGDFNGALDVVSSSDSGDPSSRLKLTTALFDEVATKTADAIDADRTAFDNGQLTREAFYHATTAQSARVTSLLSLLRSTPPPASASVDISKPYHHRIFAGSLLSQAVDNMINYLEKGDKDAGEQAKVYLVEFRKELTAAQASPDGAAPAPAKATASTGS